MKSNTPFFSRTQSLPDSSFDVIVKPDPAKGNVVEMLDPAKLVAHWRSEHWYARAPTMTDKILNTDVPFDVDPQRMHSLVGCIERGVALPAIYIEKSAGPAGGLTFPDGRHRIALFDAMGLGCILAEIPESMAEYVVGLFGAEQLDPRVRVEASAKTPRPRF